MARAHVYYLNQSQVIVPLENRDRTHWMFHYPALPHEELVFDEHDTSGAFKLVGHTVENTVGSRHNVGKIELWIHLLVLGSDEVRRAY